MTEFFEGVRLNEEVFRLEAQHPWLKGERLIRGAEQERRRADEVDSTNGREALWEWEEHQCALYNRFASNFILTMNWLIRELGHKGWGPIVELEDGEPSWWDYGFKGTVNGFTVYLWPDFESWDFGTVNVVRRFGRYFEGALAEIEGATKGERHEIRYTDMYGLEFL
tara:strand:+ start:925 stop:1425 length:501 start_codon:yes stop_codon:yes gene_type:complete